jgi:hypothetical protein
MTDDRRFPLPRGLLGMLALVAAVEGAIASRRLDFTTIWADDWRCAAEAATVQTSGLDVLCFGDSLVKYAVLPRTIGVKARLPTFNLAVNAGTMPSEYFLLRRALDSGARPRAIVVDFFPLMLADDHRGASRLYPELATARDCLDLAWTARDPDFLTKALLSMALPSYRCRFEVRASVAGAFEGRRASPWPSMSPIWSTWKAQRGAQPTHPSNARATPDPSLVADLSPTDWTCDPITAAFFERFLALAESRRIPVFWLIPPLGPEVRDRRRLTGTEAAYDRFAREALERHPEVVVLDARGSDFDSSFYVDAIHLNRRGAEALSEALAAVLAERLQPDRVIPTDRWVAMPILNAGRDIAARPGSGSGSGEDRH